MYDSNSFSFSLVMATYTLTLARDTGQRLEARVMDIVLLIRNVCHETFAKVSFQLVAMTIDPGQETR